MASRANEDPEKAVQLSLEDRLVRVKLDVARPVAEGKAVASVAVTTVTVTTAVAVLPAVAMPGAGAIAVADAVTPPVPLPTAPAAPRIFAVSELIRAARVTLESRFADVRVEGEVSGLKRSGPGHIYFCLKDAEAQLDCVMFSREAARLRFRVEEGMAVRCRGRLTIYEGRGKFQMSVTEIEPTGAGALAVAFEQLKKKLQAEGLFDAARKRRLPFLPRRCDG